MVQLIYFSYSFYNEGCRLKGLQPEDNGLGLKKVMIEFCQATSKEYTAELIQLKLRFSSFRETGKE